MNPSAAAALISLLFLGAVQEKQPTDVPENLKVPAGQELMLIARATGSQIYVCQAGTDQRLAWVLKAPEATLFDSRGAEIGRHYGGPTWKHKDGSEVTGKVAARQDAPQPDSIPWLLLNANTHTGDGIFSRISFIQRLHTKGGQPPAADTCQESKRGSEVKTPYSADYYFYAPAQR
jgi:Protein of unknown function (DUF3455)